MKILYMGSGYRPLKNILENEKFEVVGIYARENPLRINPTNTYPFLNYIEQAAEVHQVPLHKPTKITSEVVEQIMNIEYDILLSVGYHLLLPKTVINHATISTVNVHPGKLPEYKGQSPIEWALLNGEKEIGVTLHKMTEKFDEGDIILEDVVKKEKWDDGNTMQGKIYSLAADIIDTFLENPLHYLEKAKAQQGDGTYRHRLPKNISHLNWGAAPEQNVRKANLFVYPRDGAYGIIDGEKIIIDKVSANLKDNRQYSYGEIIKIKNGTVHVAGGHYEYTIPISSIRNYFSVEKKIQEGKILR